MACSPELGTTEGYPFKIDFNLLSSCCVGMLCFMCVLKCMYSYKNNFLRNKKYFKFNFNLIQRALVLEDYAPALGVAGFVSRKKGARSKGKEEKEGKK